MNKYNLKIGDRFIIKHFLGDVIVTSINELDFNVKMEHVSCSDYYDKIKFDDFNFQSEVTVEDSSKTLFGQM